MDTLSPILLIIIGLAIGTLIGAVAIYLLLRVDRKQYQARIERYIQEYETKIRNLKEQHQRAIKDARRQSVEQSRRTLKGKMAEQIAPLLPGFPYLPADSRFIGDPIDYVVFDGYTDVRDNSQKADELEVIILDIKQGKASLSRSQRAIAKAVEEGRVRFDITHVLDDGTVKVQSWRSSPAVERKKPPKREIMTSRSSENGKSTERAEQHRTEYSKAYEKWTEDEDNLLKQRSSEGVSIEDLSRLFQRKPSAIRSRLRKLGLR
jgi:predicted Holliday junction resolvase-like endonuclease